MIRLRPLLACLLSLILLVGSVAGAVAHHDRAGLMAVTLCGTDGSLVTLQIDANGNPATPGHDCPQCLAAQGLAILTSPPPVMGLNSLVADRLMPGLTAALPPAQTRGPMARGPPLTL